MTDTIANIDARLWHCYLRSTVTERVEGAAWYPNARYLVHKLADQSGVDPDRVAAVIAVLSPRISWAQNLSAAANVLGCGGRALGLGKARQKAHRLAWNATVEPSTLVTGPKVRAFWEALRGLDTAAVVDAHMYRAACVKPSPKRYIQVADALRCGAKRARLPVTAYQATVWVTERGDHV